MNLLRHAGHPTLCSLLVTACLVSACRDSNDVVGLYAAASNNGPDAAALFDGGQPACDPSAALATQRLVPNWIAIASKCAFPESWRPSDAPLGSPDAGTFTADPTSSVPQGWSARDVELMVRALSAPLLLRAEGVAPDCGDKVAWYIDASLSEGTATIMLCPALCDSLATTLREAINSGCEELAAQPLK